MVVRFAALACERMEVVITSGISFCSRQWVNGVLVIDSTGR